MQFITKLLFLGDMNLRKLLIILFIASADIRVDGQECQRSETRLTYTEAGCASGPQTHDFCSPGQKLSNRCEGECTYCGIGEYQNEFTDCSTCLKCTTEEDCCEGQKIITRCSSVRNAVCGCPPCTTITCPPSTTPDLSVEPSFQQNCPSDITIEAEEGATSSTVTWTEPVVANASAAVQSHHPGSRFRIGYTDVFYAFSGSTGNMITCSFVINVKEAPRTTSTVDPVSTTTDQPEISSRCVNPVPTTTDPPDPVSTTCNRTDSGQFSSCDGQTVCWVLLGIITVVLVLFICGVFYKCHRDEREQRIRDAELLREPARDEGDCGAPPQPRQANGNPIDDVDQGDNNFKDNGDPEHRHLLGAEGNRATEAANPQGANDKSEEGKAEASQVVDLVNDKNAIQMNSMGPSQSGDERYVNTPLQSNIGSSDQQWQFEPEELGDQYVDEHELSILATRIFRNHGGKELSDVPYFCSQLGIPSTVFNPVCMDRKKSRTDEILYYVFRDWRMASSLTRNKLRKALFDFDQGNKTSLCKLYVKIVNDRFREDSSENS
ncbi:uncharacterized protein [Apostichopus japonicus]|uniref:uncharacterized protein isoform X2 n=1 Tax=Stichopus japonicus TaxID=307972 RepID=UPI003AB228D6